MLKFFRNLLILLLFILVIGSIYTKLFIRNERSNYGYRMGQLCALEQLKDKVNPLEYLMIVIGKVTTIKNEGDSAEIKTYTIFGIPYKSFALWMTCGDAV